MAIPRKARVATAAAEDDLGTVEVLWCDRQLVFAFQLRCDEARRGGVGHGRRGHQGGHARPSETAVRSVFRLALGTHDVELIGQIRTLTGAQGLPREVLEVHMLYGIREQELRRLRDAGHPAFSLVAYGSAWYPYLTRRLAERPANLWFFLRAAASRGVIVQHHRICIRGLMDNRRAYAVVVIERMRLMARAVAAVLTSLVPAAVAADVAITAIWLSSPRKAKSRSPSPAQASAPCFRSRL